MPPARGLAGDAETATAILTALQSALDARDPKAALALFAGDGGWRDVFAFSDRVTVAESDQAIEKLLAFSFEFARPTGLKLAEGKTGPRSVTRAGQKTLECFIEFTTRLGNGLGVMRLVKKEGLNGGIDGSDRSGTGQSNANGHTTSNNHSTSADYAIWTIYTGLNELHGNEEPKGDRRASPADYSRDFGAPNWLDRRLAARAYTDRDPAVLVIGGGQAGLSIAQRLTALNVDTLIIDKETSIGDNWRNRYHSLTLHNEKFVNHMPGFPFPNSWPVFLPKDMIAGWFQYYVEAMELNFWTSTELVGGDYNEEKGEWTVDLKLADGTTRTMRPRHLVFATGVSGAPIIPSDAELPGLSSFKGTILHSSSYISGTPWRGKRALVIGTGNSAHDVAQDLHSSGCNVTMIQRNPTHIVSIQEAQRVYSVYTEGIPIEECDLVALASPYGVAVRGYQLATAMSAKADRELLERLEKVGFETTPGEDGTGFQMLYMRRGGGWVLLDRARFWLLTCPIVWLVVATTSTSAVRT